MLTPTLIPAGMAVSTKVSRPADHRVLSRSSVHRVSEARVCVLVGILIYYSLHCTGRDRVRCAPVLIPAEMNLMLTYPHPPVTKQAPHPQ